MTIRDWVVVLGVPVLLAGAAHSQGPATRADAQRLWADLGAEEPVMAWRAAHAMAGLGEGAVECIQGHCVLERPGAEAIRQWIAQLDSDQFAVRQQAGERLEQAGTAAEADLRAALAGTRSLEVRERIGQLLGALTEKAEGRRMARAVRVLELVGGEKARGLLEKIAKGSPWGGVQAGEALARLGRPVSQPAWAPAAGAACRMARWHVLSFDRRVVEKALAMGRPVAAATGGHAVFVCPDEELFALLRPGKPAGGEITGPDQTCWSQLRWFEPTLSPVADSWTHAASLRTNEDPPAGTLRFVGAGAGMFPRFSAFGGRLGIELKDSHMWAGSGTANDPSTRVSFNVGVRPGQVVCVVGSGGRVGGLDVYHWCLLHAVAMPAGDVAFLTACQDSHRWLALGAGGWARLAREGAEWAGRASPTSQPGPAWTRTLPSGAQVRLVALRNAAVHPFRYWTPDGEPAAAPIAPLNAGAAMEATLQWRSGPGVSWAHREFEWVTTPSREPGAPVAFRLGDGRWSQVAPLKVGEPFTGAAAQYTLTRASPALRKRRTLLSSHPGSTWLTLEFPETREFELVPGVVDKKGNVVGPTNDRVFVHPIADTDMTAGPRMYLINLDMDDVDHYVLLKRPRVPVRFTGMASSPKVPPDARRADAQ